MTAAAAAPTMDYAGIWLMIMAETCICNSHHVVYRLIDSTYFPHLSSDDWSVCTTLAPTHWPVSWSGMSAVAYCQIMEAINLISVGKFPLKRWVSSSSCTVAWYVGWCPPIGWPWPRPRPSVTLDCGLRTVILCLLIACNETVVH